MDFPLGCVYSGARGPPGSSARPAGSREAREGVEQVVAPSAEAALAGWAARVRANREQVERLREAPDPPDFYAPVAGTFRADPDRTDDSTLDAVRALARAGDTWLDVGAGGGRYALPLARAVSRVIAVEPSRAMRTVLEAGAREHAIRNLQIVAQRWPTAEPLRADVALIAHLGYDIEDMGPFLDALESSARRQCVALLMERAPNAAFDAFWPLVHGEPRAALPGLAEFVTLLLARGRLPELRLVGERRAQFVTMEEALARGTRWLWLREGSAKQARLRAELRARVGADGSLEMDGVRMRIGLVTWSGGSAALGG